jgi:hypothetical protein
MVDLLVGDHALGAQPLLVDVVVARLHADDTTVGDPQVHAALHAAERAVGGDQALAGHGGLPVGGRLAAGLAEEVPGARRDDRVAHQNPRLMASR